MLRVDTRTVFNASGCCGRETMELGLTTEVLLHANTNGKSTAHPKMYSGMSVCHAMNEFYVS